MKYSIIFLSLLVTSTVMAAPELGVGAMIGNPTGLNAKYWLDDTTAVDGGFAVSLGKNSDLSIHSDYLLHNKSAFFLNEVYPLDLYYGLGGRMEFADDFELGIRIPVGLAHRFNEQPVDVFAEIAPILDFVGRTGLELHLAVGGRYYF